MRKVEHTVCIARVTGWDAHVGLSTLGMRKGECERFDHMSIHVHVQFLEPIKGVSKGVVVVMTHTEDVKPRARFQESETVAMFRTTKREGIEVLVNFTTLEFSTLLAVANAGRLACVAMTISAPYRGNADVRSLQFTTTPAEQYE